MPQAEKILMESLRKNYGLNLEEIIQNIQQYLPNFDEAKFKNAFAFAALAHDGQYRKENKPYIMHPVEAMKILISMHADEDTLIATLLHDVPEDTPHTILEIEEKFGKKVAFLVEGVTKLSKVHFRSDMEARQIESLKKLFIHSTEDPRIILIKLADRLHNMRTLQYLDKPEKQIRIARETLEIFVPIANLLGIEELKSELEDLCFRFILPDEYKNIAEVLKQSFEKYHQVWEETLQLVREKLEEANIKAAVYIRKKNFHTLYKKTVEQRKRLEDLTDVISLRVLVPTREDCYKVLGILHELFKPKPSKFKDYIAVPKVNGYQSLHTTVFGPKGILTEFQIRTNRMHLEAEYGIAAYYFYGLKSKKTVHLKKGHHAYWFNKILEIQKSESTNHSFMEDLKLDILQDRIVVFTPQGDPVDLPKNASCIDFAYNIHTEVGHRALKAEVNGEIVPMSTLLRTGDTVRIITADQQKEPSRDWLLFAKTSNARVKIREYLKHESREAKIRIGRHILQREFDRAGLGLVKNIPGKKIRYYLQKKAKSEFSQFDDLLVAIGEGTLNPLEFMNELYFQEEENEKKVKEISSSSLEKKVSTQTQVGVKITLDMSEKDVVPELLRVVKNADIPLLKVKATPSIFKKTFICKMLIQVKSFQELSKLFAVLEQMSGVKKVERLFWQKKLIFTLSSLFTFFVWTIHPFALYTSHDFLISNGRNIWLSDVFVYGSLALLLFMVYSLKKLIHRSFPELRETVTLWRMTFVLTIFALLTFFAELFFFQFDFNWYIGSAIILVTLLYLAFEYLDYKEAYHR